MALQQKLAAILAIEVGDAPTCGGGAAGEMATIQCELVDPTISRFGGRIFALTPSRTLVEFAEAAPAVGCGLEIQRGLAERNAELSAERRIELKMGVDVGEVATISGDLEGSPVVIARGSPGVLPAAGSRSRAGWRGASSATSRAPRSRAAGSSRSRAAAGSRWSSCVRSAPPRRSRPGR